MTITRHEEPALQASEMRYRRLFEAARDGILILDAKSGKITDANPFILDLLSFSLNECVGKRLWEIGLFKDIKYSKDAFRELQSKGYIRYENLPLETKDGRRVDVEFIGNVYQAGDRKEIQCNIRDLTERKHAAQELMGAKAFSDILIESLPDIFYLLSPQSDILRWNRKLQELLGLSEEEMSATNALTLFHEEDRPLIARKFREAFETGMASAEARLIMKDGIRDYLLTATRVESPQGAHIIGIGIDITERKRIDKALKESEKKYRNIFGNAQVGIYRTRVNDGKLVMANDTMAKMFGFDSTDEATAQYVTTEHYVDPGSREKLLDALRKHGRFDNFESRLTRNDGAVRWFLYSGRLTQDNEYIDGIAYDITDRKLTEEAIQSSRDLLRLVVENAPMRVFWKDTELRYLGCNSAFARDAGMSHPKELYGKDDSQMAWSEQAEASHDDDRTVMESGQPKLGFEAPQTTPDGGTTWLRTSKVPLSDANGEITGILGIYEDITEQKQAAEELRRLNRALQTLSACNMMLVRATSEDELLHEITGIIVQNSNYDLATVCYAGDDPQKSIMTVAWSGAEDGNYMSQEASWADTELGQFPVARAIRNGATEICEDIANCSCHPTLWKKTALARGYASNIALPLGLGVAIGAVDIYSSKTDAFDEQEVRLLEELANDLAYGINSLRTRAEHEQHATILRQGLEQSIQTIADTVEARDPYTAGHQRRVADLAMAIAQEMGLPEAQAHGIRLAGIVHDLGKIHIPAEILAKPAKLNDIEYMLIQMHPQDGYDILKDVEFPWPIAEIILQHHEKIDGSGYPQGLNSEQMLPEAKIMAVADVVEAMASHRPYRPSLGMDAALEEIEKYRGVWYDPDVVDACIRLFRERGYRIPD